ncbi:MAG: AraC family transcriptional regulator [Clostridia bacterium]|nr:AraC family transcriptional regulator [Clostridia bacterium]
MNPYADGRFQQDCWECLYNHKRICEAVVHEGASIAKLLFHQQAQQLCALNEDREADKIETAYIMLTSLNRSLYNYILYHLNLSLTACCYQCRAHTHDVSSYAHLLNAGDSIIDSYASFLLESETRYQDIEKVCAYIKDHLDGDLSINSVCRQFYVSKSYLCNTFKELTGSTFGDYTKSQRLIRARQLILSTNLKIEAIASQCGFRSSTYFDTVFKQEMGMTPSVFRQKYAGSSQVENKTINHTPGMSFILE